MPLFYPMPATYIHTDTHPFTHAFHAYASTHISTLPIMHIQHTCSHTKTSAEGGVGALPLAYHKWAVLPSLLPWEVAARVWDEGGWIKDNR